MCRQPTHGCMHSNQVWVSFSLSSQCRVMHLALMWEHRYSAVRCQFGPSQQEEIPVLEYQTQVKSPSLFPSPHFLPSQQWRLFPYVAAVYVLSNFGMRLFNELFMLTAASIMGENTERMVRGKNINTETECLQILYNHTFMCFT